MTPEQQRLLNVARGCLDYGGGYRSDPEKLIAFHHGIETVIRALEAAVRNDPADTQVAALGWMGAACPVCGSRAVERGAAGAKCGKCGTAAEAENEP